MEIFKTNIIKFFIITILFVSCDRIYYFKTKVIDWKVTPYSNEIIHIKGVAFTHPTLNKLKIVNKSKNTRGKLLLLLNSTIPKTQTLNDIYKMPIDSLVRKISFFDKDNDSSRFFVLGLIDLDKKDTIHYKLDMPIINPNEYVFAIPSVPVLDIKISFEFQQLGDSIKLKIKKIKF